eukprot:CAMPEP_0170179038 /NCGR_PEP_ID=MMETSP0040_2-20121228/15896_1 /TAXON_ID=641309 /ORGANISM="Lotharella oceanica, Strain CCMP622" /LENGTH=462 /DNA_ID=CAMNT_0010422821 /DNA_START=232 /DNA_END=1621 /DNA_ORIENTATION=+
MSAHRSLFSEGEEGGGSGLKRSMSSAVLDEMESSNFDYYSIKSPDRIGDVKKGVSPGGSDSGAPQPLGLRSSSSCPNLQQLKEEDDTAEGQHDTTDKIKKRKARKAEVARQCRKRKKAYIQSLEEKAKALAEQLSALSNKRHKGGSNMDVEAQRKAEQQKILDKMQRLVNKSNLDDSNRELKSLITGFANNSRKRQRTCATQLKSLRDSLAPGIDTKFALWLLHQSSQGRNGNDLWKNLAKDMKLSKTQINKLNSDRNRAMEVASDMARLNQQVELLQREISQHLTKRHGILDNITSKILTSKQTAKLLLWVRQNPSCMEVLDTVWKTQSYKDGNHRSRKSESSRGTRNSSKRSSMRVKREKDMDLLPKVGPFGTALESDLSSSSLLSSSNIPFPPDGQKLSLGKDSLLTSLEGFIGGDHEARHAGGLVGSMDAQDGICGLDPGGLDPGGLDPGIAASSRLS